MVRLRVAWCGAVGSGRARLGRRGTVRLVQAQRGAAWRGAAG